MRFNYLFAILLIFFSSCTQDEKNNIEPETPTNLTATINVKIYNPNPFNVDLNANIPTLKGKIISTQPLKKYTVLLYTNGTEATIKEETVNELSEIDFDFAIPYQIESDSVVVSATNKLDEINKASVKLNVERISAKEAVEINNKDAFPGAEGHGRYTTGGRGGKVLFVTRLEDDTNEGSLRWAINQSGARIIVFRVSGIIELTSPLNISKGNFTIAGQTAPGDGICLAKDFVRLNEGVDNVIIRYLRFRTAKGSGEYDAMWGKNCSNIIIDHCSFSWGNDEVASFYDNTNFTMQWCIVSESFHNSSHPKGSHGYGGIWGGMNASFHHNLIAHHTSRNPRFCGARYHEDTRDLEIVDFRNNVIYNWGSNSIYGGEYGQHNMVNNYFKSGPATSDSKKNRIVEITDADSEWYIVGNYVDGYPTISNSNWNGGVQGASNNTNVRALSEFPMGKITTQSAEEAYGAVLAHVGASHKRDAVDLRIVDEVENRTTTYSGIYGPGIIDSESDVGGYPTLSSSASVKDNDDDGMDDEWEVANGLNPKKKEDNNLFTLNANYTNIEVYLYSLLD